MARRNLEGALRGAGGFFLKHPCPRSIRQRAGATSDALINNGRDRLTCRSENAVGCGVLALQMEPVLSIDRNNQTSQTVNMSAANPISSERRSRLLEAASGLFARWGFDKTSVEEIAADAGISKGAVYLEFPDKDSLLKAVVHQEFTRFLEDWLVRLEREEGEWSFALVFKLSLSAMGASPLVKALVTRDQRVYGTYLRRHKELLTLGISMRAQLFDRLAGAGVIREDIPAPVLAHLLSVMSYGLIIGAEVFPENAKVPFEESLHALGMLLDRGLAPTRPRNRKAVRSLVLPLIREMQVALREPGTA
jgi:TetR/AcrR family acrAB operon transcriptional repressor